MGPFFFCCVPSSSRPPYWRAGCVWLTHPHCVRHQSFITSPQLRSCDVSSSTPVWAHGHVARRRVKRSLCPFWSSDINRDGQRVSSHSRFTQMTAKYPASSLHSSVLQSAPSAQFSCQLWHFIPRSPPVFWSKKSDEQHQWAAHEALHLHQLKRRRRDEVSITYAPPPQRGSGKQLSVTWGRRHEAKNRSWFQLFKHTQLESYVVQVF